MFLGQKKGVLMLIIFVISVVLSVVMIGVIGFVVLFAWWIYDAIQIPKWIEEKKTDLRSKIQAEMQ